uniref:Uncharacterized protein n=1 Tax=Glossina palpalis gambiensis TaxID=67801 RepID=A0A1B0B1P1_9MUSC
MGTRVSHGRDDPCCEDCRKCRVKRPSDINYLQLKALKTNLSLIRTDTAVVEGGVQQYIGMFYSVNKPY